MKNLDDENQHKTKEDKNVLNGYVIDYKTFNYIDKVIDNPEKWRNLCIRKCQPIKPLHHLILPIKK